ncbi:MAG: zinc-ribbon domain-containing protein [Holosporaceae bacterium]|nr:zinc-ribbon domain-containing protein [Holosporaceae bacterium]
MVVTCPGCHCKYSVQPNVIGDSKMVRCALCSTTWQQDFVDESALNKKNHVEHIKWILFWFTVFVSLFSLFFTKNIVIKIWPPAICFYDFFGIGPHDTKKMFAIQNVSNFFVRKNNKLYMGLKGELINVSNDVQIMPSLVISLKNDDQASKVPYRKVWTHDLMYNKLLPNQKVLFETELQSVPYNDLICDIKLDVL